MTEQVKKPEHNKLDNIFEIRKAWKGIEDRISEAMVGRVPRQPRRVGNALIYDDVEAFIRRIRQGNITLPIFKILMPELDFNSGSIYYVVRGMEGSNHIFRGTFGYGGTGPHESALVEEVLERMNCMIELRSGDYLLSFIE